MDATQAYVIELLGVAATDERRYEGRGGHVTTDLQKALVTVSDGGRRMRYRVSTGSARLIPVRIVEV